MRSKISLQAKWPICPQGQLLKCAGRSSFKRLILATPLNLILLRNISDVGSDDVKYQDCKYGKVNQKPTISYTQFRYKLWVTEPNTIEIKLPGGDQFTCDLMNDAGNAETYLKWIQVYDCVLGKKKLRVNLNVTTEERKKVLEEKKKFLKVLKRDTPGLKVAQELEVTVTKVKLTEASTVHTIAIWA